MTIDAYCVLGVDREYDLTPDALLRAMDEAQVDAAVIAPVDRFLAVANGEGNRCILDAAEKHPGRLFPACTVNPWRTDASDRLRDAIRAGGRMAALHPSVQGFQANDELVWPLVEVAAQERVPVYIHTGAPGSATPWQVADLATRFPTADLIMGHCGATDFWNDVPAATRSAGNIWIESSLARPFLFASHLKQVGKARGIMGSFAPLNDLAFEWEQIRLALPPEAQPDVLGGNLLRLLEKRGGP